VVSDRDIRLQRLIDAPIEVTFHHWTDSEARRHWSAPEDGWITEATSDLRVGGTWSVRFGPTAEEMYTVEGVYQEVDPPNRLAYSSVFRYPDGRSFETLTTVTFEARSGQTLLTFIDAGFPAGEDLGMFENGTVAVLDAFTRVVDASAS
jgi:uncharacterized protein YndB with AHSA1/START domain